MAKLTTVQRNALPRSSFAIPEKRAYPIHDEEHARMALSMVSKYGSPDEVSRVRKKVKKKFPGIQQEGMTAPRGTMMK